MMSPRDPAYPRGYHRAKARLLFARLLKELGLEHYATRAAAGRAWYHARRVPQADSVTPEAIAWYRESGARPGFLNRSERRHRGGIAPRFATVGAVGELPHPQGDV